MVIPERLCVWRYGGATGCVVFLALGLVVQLGVFASVSQAAGVALPSRAKVAAEMQPLVNNGSYAGIVIGVVGPEGRRVFGFGTVRLGTNASPSGQTVFPLASITKTFTGDLLADFVLRGIVRLDDPVARFLPPGVIGRGNPLERVTLLDLATHMSGLPKMPNNAVPLPLDPLARPYSAGQMYDFLSHYRGPGPSAGTFRYSNIGIALLGHALARAGGIPYEKLVQTRICRPLGMTSTRFEPDASMRRRIAQGYGKNSRPVPPRKFDVGKSSGGLYSTTDDMMTYLAANMGFVQAGIVPALREAQEPRRRVPDKQNAFMGLTWHVRKLGSREFVSKNGGLAGFQSFIAFSPTDKVGIIALANSSPENRKLDAACRRLLQDMVFHRTGP